MASFLPPIQVFSGRPFLCFRPPCDSLSARFPTLFLPREDSPLGRVHFSGLPCLLVAVRDRETPPRFPLTSSTEPRPISFSSSHLFAFPLYSGRPTLLGGFPTHFPRILSLKCCSTAQPFSRVCLFSPNLQIAPLFRWMGFCHPVSLSQSLHPFFFLSV